MIACVKPLFVDLVHAFMKKEEGLFDISLKGTSTMFSASGFAIPCPLTAGEPIPMCLLESGKSISAAGFGFVGSVPVPSEYYYDVTYLLFYFLYYFCFDCLVFDHLQ